MAAGTPLDIVATTDDGGAYSIIGPAGTWPTDVTKDGYVRSRQELTIVAGVTTPGVDVDAPPRSSRTPRSTATPIPFLLTPGRHRPRRPDRSATPRATPTALHRRRGRPRRRHGARWPAGPAKRDRCRPALDPNARSTRGFGAAAAGTAVPPRLAADGDVLASWPTGLTAAVGRRLRRRRLARAIPIDHDRRPRSRTAGDAARRLRRSTGFGDWGARHGLRPGRGLIWQVNVGGDNGIYGLDPTDGSVKQMITGSPWDDTSQRGLAYDPAADVFYIGGWNEGIVYRVAGPSHPTPGETLGQCSPPDPNISGLAWNGSFGMLWEATNSETDTIYLIDPLTCETTRGDPHPDGGGFGGAGLELDAVGNLWTVGQNSRQRVPRRIGPADFSRRPVADRQPDRGHASPPTASVDLDVDVDATGLDAPASTGRSSSSRPNDPDHAIVQVPVTLVVPAYQQGVNAGGRPVRRPATATSTPPIARSVSGPFGYVRRGFDAQSTGARDRRTPTDDGRYQNLRIGHDRLQVRRRRTASTRSTSASPSSSLPAAPADASSTSSHRGHDRVLRVARRRR